LRTAASLVVFHAIIAGNALIFTSVLSLPISRIWSACLSRSAVAACRRFDLCAMGLRINRPWTIQGLSILLDASACLARRMFDPLSPTGASPHCGHSCSRPDISRMVDGSQCTSYFDADLAALLPKASPAPGAPGSADGPASASAMFFFTGLLGVFLFCCDLSQHSVWRKRIWMTMALTGFSIAAFGILQKIGAKRFWV